MSVHTSAIPIEMLDDNLGALMVAGGYDSEREMIRDALEALVDANPALRLELAMTLWKEKKITLSRAVEIAQSDHESFKQEIAKRGLFIEIDSDVEEILKAEERIRHIRRTQ
jgi:predicted HTH domain antitoxin